MTVAEIHIRHRTGRLAGMHTSAAEQKTQNKQQLQQQQQQQQQQRHQQQTLTLNNFLQQTKTRY